MDDFFSMARWPRVGPNTYEHTIAESWYQGRGAYGGLVAAALVHAMNLERPDPGQRLRTATFHFSAPLVAAPARLTTTLVRAGNSVSHMRAEIVQDGTVVAFAQAAYARDKTPAEGGPNPDDFDRTRMPDVPPPDEVPQAPDSPLFPTFAKHFEYRFCVGGYPYSASDEAHVGGWSRLAGGGQLDELLALAYLDMWPPSILNRMDVPRAAATVTLHVVFHDVLPLEGATADNFYLVSNRSLRALAGYVEESGELWSPDGRLIAESKQFISVFG